MAGLLLLIFDDRSCVSDLAQAFLCTALAAGRSLYPNAFLTLFVALSHWRYGCNMHGRYAEFFEGIVFEIHLSFLTLHFSDGLYRCHTLKYITWYLLLAIYGRYGTDVRMKRRVNGRIYGWSKRILTEAIYGRN